MQPDPIQEIAVFEDSPRAEVGASRIRRRHEFPPPAAERDRPRRLAGALRRRNRRPVRRLDGVFPLTQPADWRFRAAPPAGVRFPTQAIDAL